MTGNETRLDVAALYLRHRDAMHRAAGLVLRGAGRESEASDAVQDAVVSIMASLPRDVRNWEAFLVTVAKRKALDRVRSAEVRHAGGELVETAHDSADPDRSHVAEDVADAIDQRRRAALARDCLTTVLDDRHRKAVWETQVLGRTRAEVAAELNVSPARVSQMTTRGLALLREAMQRREEGNDG
ncbi:sigma-70 family RNA polymerase sigma factor [Georgenia satyanarayanai]|uniref:sigma-70 family RNA polymerase sigma factor n=1 Tax=Georgenia satyanarayanai TaxID=860221 RepID=UPI002040D4EE|nr:sigma-70 family RNA polymerase sigma factor [Georgenia satyanarayanai]MCM3662502.1 sigma-70 family RNA polymerase sigma factor [Georgenia satyanarayanai]